MRIESISIGVVVLLGTVVGMTAALSLVVTLAIIEVSPKIAPSAVHAAASKAEAIRLDIARRLHITEAQK